MKAKKQTPTFAGRPAPLNNRGGRYQSTVDVFHNRRHHQRFSVFTDDPTPQVALEEMRRLYIDSGHVRFTKPIVVEMECAGETLRLEINPATEEA